MSSLTYLLTYLLTFFFTYLLTYSLTYKPAKNKRIISARRLFTHMHHEKTKNCEDTRVCSYQFFAKHLKQNQAEQSKAAVSGMRTSRSSAERSSQAHFELHSTVGFVVNKTSAREQDGGSNEPGNPSDLVYTLGIQSCLLRYGDWRHYSVGARRVQSTDPSESTDLCV